MDKGSKRCRGVSDHPEKNKKYKKAKWLSEKALQIAEGKIEAKGKGERERYTQLNAELREEQGEIRLS